MQLGGTREEEPRKSAPCADVGNVGTLMIGSSKAWSVLKDGDGRGVGVKAAAGVDDDAVSAAVCIDEPSRNDLEFVAPLAETTQTKLGPDAAPLALRCRALAEEDIRLALAEQVEVRAVQDCDDAADVKPPSETHEDDDRPAEERRLRSGSSSRSRGFDFDADGGRRLSDARALQSRHAPARLAAVAVAPNSVERREGRRSRGWCWCAARRRRRRRPLSFGHAPRAPSPASRGRTDRKS